MKRGLRGYRDASGGRLVEPIAYADMDSEGRAVLAVGAEVGRLHFAVEARAWPGSPVYRLGWWIVDYSRRRDARREGAVP